jgi:hypothetical protein
MSRWIGLEGPQLSNRGSDAIVENQGEMDVVRIMTSSGPRGNRINHVVALAKECLCLERGKRRGFIVVIVVFRGGFWRFGLRISDGQWSWMDVYEGRRRRG